MILNKIREKTFVYHDDFTGWANKILTGTADKEHYKDVLKTFYGFYYPFEQKLENVEEWKNHDFDLKRRRKSQMLIEDMKKLGISDDEIKDIKMCEKLPKMDNLADALGCMYVVEGATLGGQIVANKINEVLGFDGDNGASFFSSYKENLRPMWKEFSDFINKYSDDTNITDPIVDASDETYHRFNDWLAKLR